MDLNHLRVFHEVVMRGGFTRAAKVLHISQPTVSKSIRSLEQAQGVKLLDRSHGMLKLTSEGRVLQQSCKRVFEELDRLSSGIEDAQRESVGELSIGASDNLMNYLLPPIVAEFSKQNKGLKIHLFSGASSEIKREILDDRIQLGIFYTAPRESSFKRKRLGEVYFVPVVGPHSFWFKNGFFDATQALEVPMIGCGRVEYSKSYPIYRMLASLDVRPHYRIDANSQEAQKRLAIQGAGYAVLPEFMAHEDAKLGKLRILKTARAMKAPVYLVSAAQRSPTPQTRAFNRFLDGGSQKKNFLSPDRGIDFLRNR